MLAIGTTGNVLIQWWDLRRDLCTMVVMEEEVIYKEWEEEAAFHKEEVGPVALKTSSMEEEEVVGTTMVEVSRVEEGEDRFGEAEVVMVGGEEEGGTRINCCRYNLGESKYRWEQL
jgi:hypothetical protein